MTNVSITKNTTIAPFPFSTGVAAFIKNSTITMKRCHIADNNSATAFNTVDVDSSTVNIINSNIVRSTVDGGAGIISYNSGYFLIVNSIIYDNEQITEDFGGYGILPNAFTWSGGEGFGSGTGVIWYSDVKDGWTGTGNIDADPLFVDATNGDYNLQQSSPCIDAGDPTSPYDPDGSIADMGALPSAYGTPVPIVINIPTDYSTIQAGLTAAGTNDTVLVQPGTYTENIIWPETNGIKLISAGDSSNTIIDGGGISSVIYMNPQSATIDTTTLIQGFKITNGGNVSEGGGILCIGASPQFKSLMILGNQADDLGGGISIKNSSAQLKKSLVLMFQCHIQAY